MQSIITLVNSYTWSYVADIASQVWTLRSAKSSSSDVELMAPEFTNGLNGLSIKNGLF